MEKCQEIAFEIRRIEGWSLESYTYGDWRSWKHSKIAKTWYGKIGVAECIGSLQLPVIH